MPNFLATAEATDFGSDIVAIAMRRDDSYILQGLPPLRPRVLVALSHAFVLSITSSLSNSASDANISQIKRN